MIFKIIGAAAAAANLLFEFKIPEKKEERLTNNKKGNVILVNSTARLNFSVFSKKPGAITYTKYGVNTSANKTIKQSIRINKLKTSSANFFPFILLSVLTETQLGIKAALNVPSANKRLKVFGSLKATKYASAKIDAPKNIAINTSLRQPKILLNKVKKLNTYVDDSKFI